MSCLLWPKTSICVGFRLLDSIERVFLSGVIRGQRTIPKAAPQNQPLHCSEFYLLACWGRFSTRFTVGTYKWATWTTKVAY